MSVQLAKNVDVSKLKYSEVKGLASGAKSVYINYGTEKLSIQTPVMTLPYGLGVPFENKEAVKTGNTPLEKEKKYDLTLSLRGMDENPKIKSFHDKLKEIESKVIDDAFNNRLAWFKDDYDGNKSLVARLFTPIIKLDKDATTGKIVGKYPPTFKAKLPYDTKTDKFTFDAYNMDNEEIDFVEIMKKLKGAKVQGIVQLTGIWFAGGKYGCSWKFVSAKFQLSQSHKMTYIEDSDTEKIGDGDEDDASSIDVDLSSVKKALTFEENLKNEDDDEEEDDDNDTPQAPPQPPPAPTKKTVSRRR
jgi:hypothetical protein